MSNPVAGTPSRQSAWISRSRGNAVRCAGIRPSSTCLDSGGRSYGSKGSSPTRVSDPAKPSSRSFSAARNPASDAPTITTRPACMKSPSVAAAGSGETSDPWSANRRGLDLERLDRAGGRGPQHPRALALVRLEVVVQRFLAGHREHVRSEEHALAVALAPGKVDDDSHGNLPKRWGEPVCPRKLGSRSPLGGAATARGRGSRGHANPATTRATSVVVRSWRRRKTGLRRAFPAIRDSRRTTKRPLTQVA